MLGCGVARSRHHEVVRSTGDEHTAEVDDLAAVFSVELIPVFVGSLQQGHVVRMLEIGLADDAGFAVGTAAIMGEEILLQAQDALTAPGEMPGRGRAHAAEADDNGIVHEGISRVVYRSSPAVATRN